MEKLISYICSDVTMLKHDTGVTIKNFKKQGKINRGFALLFILVGAYAYLNEVRYEKLREEVEELKKSKGE
jgi:hypothetical protein